MSLWQKYKNFIRGVSVNRIGKTGVVLTTAVVITFFVFEAAQTVGLIRNAYLGLLTYLAFPVLFIVGLILIPIGWAKLKKETGKSTQELLNQQFEPDELKPGLLGSSIVRTIAVFTLLNVVILTTASLRMLHFMDSAYFCGTACHTVMNPEWMTYQRSPHARVPCVECHVGEGVNALIKSKLNGVRQMYLAAFRIYNTPIPTPVHQLRPARETCEHCHWPEKFYGQRLKTIISYAMDSLSTPRYTTLNIKIDAGGPGHPPGAHWHVGAKNQVIYTSEDDKRLTMIEVSARQADGSTHVYRNRRFNRPTGESKPRVMDCVDCHNRATHIYQEAEAVVDESIRRGLLDPALPFIKKEALGALSANYPSQEAAQKGIADRLYNTYKRRYTEAAQKHSDALTQAVTVLQEAYATYIHPQMKITWGTYPSHIGHKRRLGCFRCHNADMIDEKGISIAHDCTLCHSILAMESPERFEFLSEPNKGMREAQMHQYLREEFFKSKF
ncbi:MAG: NapC/NirT family cytochrome c [candidate division KSB1 bacterium]|nr:NapC/NirT family cytochrome c [candidate division KSB1 bacterium]MDZ7345756.1 NapC/NirT family cytochrome c [candidate division KSB1 bacterium]